MWRLFILSYPPWDLEVVNIFCVCHCYFQTISSSSTSPNPMSFEVHAIRLYYLLPYSLWSQDNSSSFTDDFNTRLKIYYPAWPPWPSIWIIHLTSQSLSSSISTSHHFHFISVIALTFSSPKVASPLSIRLSDYSCCPFVTSTLGLPFQKFLYTVKVSNLCFYY